MEADGFLLDMGDRVASSSHQDGWVKKAPWTECTHVFLKSHGKVPRRFYTVVSQSIDAVSVSYRCWRVLWRTRLFFL